MYLFVVFSVVLSLFYCFDDVQHFGMFLLIHVKRIKWFGMEWIGLDETGVDWIGMHWTGMD